MHEVDSTQSANIFIESHKHLAEAMAAQGLKHPPHNNLTTHFITSLAKGGYVFNSVGLSVCVLHLPTLLKMLELKGLH